MSNTYDLPPTSANMIRSISYPPLPTQSNSTSFENSSVTPILNELLTIEDLKDQINDLNSILFNSFDLKRLISIRDEILSISTLNTPNITIEIQSKLKELLELIVSHSNKITQTYLLFQSLNQNFESFKESTEAESMNYEEIRELELDIISTWEEFKLIIDIIKELASREVEAENELSRREILKKRILNGLDSSAGRREVIVDRIVNEAWIKAKSEKIENVNVMSHSGWIFITSPFVELKKVIDENEDDEEQDDDVPLGLNRAQSLARTLSGKTLVEVQIQPSYSGVNSVDLERQPLNSNSIIQEGTNGKTWKSRLIDKWNSNWKSITVQVVLVTVVAVGIIVLTLRIK